VLARTSDRHVTGAESGTAAALNDEEVKGVCRICSGRLIKIPLLFHQIPIMPCIFLKLSTLKVTLERGRYRTFVERAMEKCQREREGGREGEGV
jgi:hypothetical protein